MGRQPQGLNLLTPRAQNLGKTGPISLKYLPHLKGKEGPGPEELRTPTPAFLPVGIGPGDHAQCS